MKPGIRLALACFDQNVQIVISMEFLFPRNLLSLPEKQQIPSRLRPVGMTNSRDSP